MFSRTYFLASLTSILSVIKQFYFMTAGIKRAIYLHGGPGANSLGEQALLGPALLELGIECAFWNEPPAPAAPQNAFEHALASARMALSRARAERAPCLLIAHSFAALYALEILRTEPGAISALLLVTPSPTLFPLFMNVLRLAEKDLGRANPSASAALSQLISETQALMDPAMRRAFEIAATDPDLFSHYWQDRAAMENYYGVWAKAGANFELNTFIAVLEGLSKRPTPSDLPRPFDRPVEILFGKKDPVVCLETELARVKTNFPSARLNLLEGCGHYPHIERPEAFLGACRRLTES
jgi:pimeloyl-ACP methyl ester carboxylesterase